MTIPYITKEQMLALFDPIGVDASLREFNRRIDLANAQQETYISADEARKLGAGNVEYFAPDADPPTWQSCHGAVIIDCFRSTNETIKYRAIQPQAQPEPVEDDAGFLKRFKENVLADVRRDLQPEPVDPRAALRAEYAKQVAEGTTGFYLWECKSSQEHEFRTIKTSLGEFYHGFLYRCTDISCMVSKDGEPAIRMLRTEAQELQAELGDTVEWFTPQKFTNATNESLSFVKEGTYTYRTKPAKVVAWTGSRDDVIDLLKEVGLLK